MHSEVPLPVELLPHAEFAFPGELRDRLVAAILSGEKTATTSMVAEYAVENEPLPAVGARQVVIDSHERPVAVIETTDVRQLPLHAVPWEHARDEGEGFRSVAEWRASHERFWSSAEMRDYLGDPDFTVTDDTMLVLERFQLVQIL